jgi:hypothetical protein
MPARRGRAYGEREGVRQRTAVDPGLAMLLVAALSLGGCAGSDSVAVSDTYCRDTFYWRTGPRDTAETRRDADRHNSRRLCKCERDCD